MNHIKTNRKQLLVIDPAGNRNFSDEERNFLPKGPWQPVIAGINNLEAIAQSEAVLLRADPKMDLCKMLEALNSKSLSNIGKIIAANLVVRSLLVWRD